MRLDVQFHVTPAEFGAIQRQIDVFRGDHNADGSDRTDTDRTVNAVAVILDDKVAGELRDFLSAGNVVEWVVRLPEPFYRFSTVSR